MKLLYVNPELQISESVAVVGSSGKLVETEYGEEIDTFEDVMRFNRAPTEGFERWVGSKTTVRCVNNHVFNNNKLREDEWSNQPQYFIRDLRNTNILYIAEDLVPFWNKDKNTHSSNQVFLYDYRTVELYKKYFNLLKNPTVGVCFILTCIFSGVRPVCYGFDSGKEDAEYVRTHYYGSRPQPSGYHGVNEEKNLLIELDEEGLIILK